MRYIYVGRANVVSLTLCFLTQRKAPSSQLKDPVRVSVIVATSPPRTRCGWEGVCFWLEQLCRQQCRMEDTEIYQVGLQSQGGEEKFSLFLFLEMNQNQQAGNR